MNQPDHAASMDRIYRYQRHIYDLTRKYYLFGRDRAIAQMGPVNRVASLLEIGCGTGRNLCVASRKYPLLHAYGLDASNQMLSTAARKIVSQRLADRITLAAADATDFDAIALFGRPHFDRVLIPYSLSMIPQWKQALANAFAVTSPGGSIHCVDFGRQEKLPGWMRSALRLWLSRFEVTPRDDLIDVFNEYARRAGLQSIRHDSFGGGYGVLLSAEKA